MSLLLDSHAFVWWTLDDPKLSKTGRAAISAAPVVFVSVVTPWEIAIKVGTGKWLEAKPTLDDFEAIVLRNQFRLLAISVPHVRAVALIQAAHRDPFDRLLAAQAVAEGLTLVTADPHMPSLGARVLW